MRSPFKHREAIAGPSPRANLRVVDLAPPLGSLLAEVVAGLSRPHKQLPAKLFYDQQGSALFQAICSTEAYYLTRTEESIFRAHGDDLKRSIGSGAVLIEPGAGDMRKARLLLPVLRPSDYVAIDISRVQLTEAAASLADDFPWLQVMAVAGDYQASALRRIPLPEGARRIVFFPGSTIGNFDPPDAAEFLRQVCLLVGKGGGLLIGVDLVKDKAILDLAYNDPQGYTEQFNLNMLAHLNRALGGDFDLGSFAHLSFYNHEQSRIEMHLVSRRTQSVVLGGRSFRFKQGEAIHTENSYKYTPERFLALARQTGFGAARLWTDPQGLFGVFFLSA
jgi:dimethylhistidine N-methyltransferase